MPTRRGHGEFILIADDEKAIRDIMATILNRQGYRVFLACDGIEAAKVFEENASEIELVITDCDMPNMKWAGSLRTYPRPKTGNEDSCD